MTGDAFAIHHPLEPPTDQRAKHEAIPQKPTIATYSFRPTIPAPMQLVPHGRTLPIRHCALSHRLGWRNAMPTNLPTS